jgi:hypothetical protein
MAFAPQPDASLVETGSLYVEAQSRAIWLGVDESIDPNESILVSDIAGLLASDAETLTNAKAYTDTQITTRAPVVHNHTSSQITDFSAAVTAVVGGIPSFNWVSGMIMMWSGSLSSIGVGGLAGWSLCDGSNGTPDLRDRFVIGAGNKVPGTKDALPALPTDTDPGHTHVAAGTALTTAQIPSHAHGPGSLQGPLVNGYAFNNGAHQHFFNMYSRQDTGSAVPGTWAVGGGSDQADQYSDTQGSHDHTVSGVAQMNAGASAAAGGGGSHTHTIGAGGAHAHSISKSDLRESIPYYALAYIMKL